MEVMSSSFCGSLFCCSIFGTLNHLTSDLSLLRLARLAGYYLPAFFTGCKATSLVKMILP
jgi:hypothetical protein